MKYEKAKQALTKLGAKFLTETELKDLCKADTYFYPYGCLHCGKAQGKSDFTDILYVEFSKGGAKLKLLIAPFYPLTFPRRLA